jgi:hypothetical protein
MNYNKKPVYTASPALRNKIMAAGRPAKPAAAMVRAAGPYAPIATPPLALTINDLNEITPEAIIDKDVRIVAHTDSDVGYVNLAGIIRAIIAREVIPLFPPAEAEIRPATENDPQATETNLIHTGTVTGLDVVLAPGLYRVILLGGGGAGGPTNSPLGSDRVYGGGASGIVIGSTIYAASGGGGGGFRDRDGYTVMGQRGLTISSGSFLSDSAAEVNTGGTGGNTSNPGSGGGQYLNGIAGEQTGGGSAGGASGGSPATYGGPGGMLDLIINSPDKEVALVLYNGRGGIPVPNRNGQAGQAGIATIHNLNL